MKELFDAFWRALAYCLHPRVIWLSLLPLLIGAGVLMLAGWLYWDAAVAAVRGTLESWTLVDSVLRWLEGLLGLSFRDLLAPMIAVMLALPLVVVMSLLLVALLMAPAIVRLVATRRFPELERRHGAGFATGLWVSLSSTVLALALLVVTIPLWFVPPLVLVLPPLIWGWLTFRVMSHDALSEHADALERRDLMRQCRGQLLAIGVICGYLGAAPTLLWAVSAATLVLAPILIPLSVWIYTLVFAFSSLWFTHFCLDALQRMRRQTQAQAPSIDSALSALAPDAPALPRR